MSDIKIKRVDSKSYMVLGSESVELADYHIKSSADGTTELHIVIKDLSEVFEMSATLKEWTQSNQ